MEGATGLAVKAHTLGGTATRIVIDPIAIGALDLVGSHGGRVEQLAQVWSTRWCQFYSHAPLNEKYFFSLVAHLLSLSYFIPAP